MTFKIDDDYIDVAERIRVFYDQYPDGRLTTVDWDVKPDLDGKAFVWVHAKAYRTPDDPLPGDGIAWEPIPGPTPFTRDSELMNAQTSAWGRAIIALGFATKKLASKEEVQAHAGNDDVHGLQESRGDAVEPGQIIVPFGKHKGKTVQEVPTSYWEWWLKQDGNKNEELLAAVELHLGLTATPAGAPNVDDDIPF
jgi:uncharacterized protein (DUF3820 family)